uniref:Insulin-degrading enzyme-like n=1 Tax=Arabidopsis thaliana TaxID=3702 RepID=Q1PE08_ARATH|nr:insulin-degrading enzyme-like [Arabidopsis thaliana]
MLACNCWALKLTEFQIYFATRIEEKLGYLVECETRLIHGVGFYVCVVSSDYNPCHLVRRIYKFMNGIRLVSLSIIS